MQPSEHGALSVQRTGVGSSKFRPFIPASHQVNRQAMNLELQTLLKLPSGCSMIGRRVAIPLSGQVQVHCLKISSEPEQWQPSIEEIANRVPRRLTGSLVSGHQLLKSNS